jgi:hypothetical protein
MGADGRERHSSSTGTTEIVDGSGGHGHQAQVTTDSRLAASDFTHFGALRVSLGTSGALPVRVHRRGHPRLRLDPVPGRAPGQDAALSAAEPDRDGASRTQVQLSWDASTDDVGVTAYDIYRTAPDRQRGAACRVPINRYRRERPTTTM